MTDMDELAKIIDVHLIMNEVENKVDAYDIAKDIINNGYRKVNNGGRKMLNKEKFVKEFIELGTEGSALALRNGIPAACDKINCGECDWRSVNCHMERIKWANSEYIEKPVGPGWEIDTNVLVSNDGDHWVRVHYAGFDNDFWEEPYRAWDSGRTQFTSAPREFTNWKYAKLPEDK